MPDGSEQRGPRRVAGRAIVVGLLVLAATPAYLALEPPWRFAVLRVACAAGVAIVCARVARAVRGTLDEYPASPLDEPAPAPPAPALDAFFLRLRDHLAVSVRSRRYFDAVLWPRLGALARAPLAKPAPRRWFSRLGPSWATLESLIAQIERRG